VAVSMPAEKKNTQKKTIFGLATIKI